MKTISIDSRNPLVDCHRIQQKCTLPGMAYIDLLYREIHDKLGNVFSYVLQDLTILNPLQLEEGSNCELEIQMNTIEEGFSFEITGIKDQKKSHRFPLLRVKVIKKQTDSINEERNFNSPSGDKSIDLETIYRHYRERDLEHVTFMKAEGTLYTNSSEWITKVSLSDLAKEYSDAFFFHPTLLDGAAVSLAFGVKESIQATGMIMLPLYIEEVEVYGPIQEECYATVNRESITFSGDLLKFSIDFYDNQGNLLVKLKNFSAKRLRNDKKIEESTVALKKKVISGAKDAESYLMKLFERKSKISTQHIKRDSGFYEWGLSSSELMSIVQELEKKISKDLSPTLLFEYTTLESLAAHLESTYPNIFGIEEDFHKILETNNISNDSIKSKKNKQHISEISSDSSGDVAIIGLAGRYPEADNLEEFWENLTKGIDAVSTIPTSRWNWKDFEAVETPSGKPISKWGGFINDVASFDAPFFKVSPKEAETLDPQERWFLQTSWEAMEDAGYTPDNLVKPVGKNNLREVGVFAGVMHKDYGILGWEHLRKEQANLSLNYAPIPNRVSYFCNFHGPSMAVDTVCSSSSTAIHLAMQSLKNKECKVALAGGVNLSLHPAKYISYGLSNFHATDGRCRAFGSDGDGYVSSEGVGVAVLKPLEDAIRDQDQIYSVLKGSSINHVGKVSGITVPGPIAQQELISACYEKSKVHPEQISYIEAHGTGTILGDPIEVEALTKAFRQKTRKMQYCAIGSLKSNIGHTEAAAGIAALSKVALQLHHKKQVPSLHASNENPYLKLKQTPFYVQKHFEDWKQVKGTRTAGVSSFGATGTNVHLVLQEYVPDQPLHFNKEFFSQKNAIIPLSAKNKKQLIAYADRLLLQLKNRRSVHAHEEVPGSLSANMIVKDFEKEIQYKLASVLRVDPINISLDTEWQEFGLDTYQYSELQLWLHKKFSRKLKLSELEVFTIQSFAQQLTEFSSNNKQIQSKENEERHYLHQIAYTFQTGRIALEERAAFITSSLEDLIIKLQLFVQDENAGADYQANKGDHEQLLTSFTLDEDFDLLIRTWLNKGKSNKIAEIWTKGYPINWSNMYNDIGIPGKTKVPTYPFSKKEYWLPIAEASSKKQEKNGTVGQITPLVHRNESGFGRTRFSSSFLGEEFFLTDHKVENKSILPGVAHIEAAYQSFTKALEKPNANVNISNIHFIRPVILNEGSCKIVIDLEKESKNYSYSIRQKDGAETIMSQGNIMVGENNIYDQLNVESYFDSKVYEITEGELIYEQFDRMGIQYGKAHQCIVRAFHRIDEVAVQLTLDPIFHDTLDSYQLHPGLVDAALQATLLLEKNDKNQLVWKSLTKAKMPFSIGNISIIKPCTATMWAVAELQKRTITGNTISKISLYNDALELVTVIEDFVTNEVVEQQLPDAISETPYSFESNKPEIVQLLPSWKVVGKQQLNVTIDDSKTTYLCINCPEVIQDSLRKKSDYVVFTTTAELLDTDFNVLFKNEVEFDQIMWWIPSSLGSLQKAQEEGIYFGYKLLNACIENKYESKKLLWTVITAEAYSVEGYPISDPTHAGIEGLMSSVIKEYYKWQIRLIDQARGFKENLDQLGKIPFDKEGRIWAIRDGEWYRQLLTPIKETSKNLSKSTYRSKGVYVIIGGAGNIGRDWSKHMISNFDAKIIWIGRRKLSESIEKKIQEVGKGQNQPAYYQADVTKINEIQNVFEDIKYLYKNIDGVINAAMVMEEKELINVTEAEFRKGYETKQKSVCNLISVLESEPLDFLLLFSSMVSFIKTPRLSYYAAGNTFMDAYAKSKQKNSAFPIKIVNWGYWKTEKLKEAKDFEKLQSIGIQPIIASEGIQALDFLLKTNIPQLGIMKFSKPLDFSGYSKNTIYKYFTPNLQSIYDLDSITRTYTKPEKISELHTQSAYEDVTFTQLIGQIAYQQLDSIGVLNPEKAKGLLENWGTPDYFKDWLNQSMKFFVDQQNGKRIDKDVLWKSWDLYAEKEKENLDKKFHIDLAKATLKALPAILKNKVKPTDILFPNSSMEKVVNIYKNNTISNYYNSVLSTCVLTYIKSRLKQNRNSKIRILEVGAGTGGTSALLFEKLEPWKEIISEYCYTDISQAFLNFAESTYGEGRPYLKFKKFNAEDEVHKQQFDVGDYDIVLGTNVLHATSNIRNSLKNCQSLLKPGGLFLLNEMSKNMPFTHFTFGLLKGWWLPNDKETRIPGCPGLAPNQWEKVLSQSGYEDIAFPVESTHHLGQQIIWALAKDIREEGIIKTTALEKQSVDKTTQTLSHDKKVGGYNDQIIIYLRKVISRVLKLPLEEVSEKESFENYGIDSILIVQLTNELRKDFDGISGTLFFEHKNLNSIASNFMLEHKVAVEAFFDTKKVANVSQEATILKEEFPSQETIKISDNISVQSKPLVSKKEDISDQLDEIAVIGLAGKYPGANTIQEYWENLKGSKNCITEIPSDRWEWQKYFGKKHEIENGSYSRWGGFMDAIDEFDPLFFKISPLEAEKMDPQERLFLQSAYTCIEDAGYQPKDLSAKKRVGVFAGVMNSTYNRQSNHWSISNRVSYALDFQGPSLTVDTACSSSLMAIYLAVESIQTGQCDCAIAGGVNVIATPGHYNRLAGANMLSRGNSNNTFGSGADGFVDAEGVGTLLLKSKKKALEDGDVIYGIIKGGSTNSGGKTIGYTVPNPIAQADLIKTALERTKVDPKTISYIEAHGTGTSLGDPIEISGLTKAYRNFTDRKQFCAIGSSKSNIGHCESAAGIGGLTKILLQFVNKKMVPSLHCDPLNSEIDFDSTPFYVQKKTEIWEQPKILENGELKTYPRRAAISSFGAGGTNVHLILEEAKSLVTPEASLKNELIVLSGATNEQLEETVQNLLFFLKKEENPVVLSSVAYTLQIGRKELEHRLAFVVKDVRELIEQLSIYLENPKDSYFQMGTVLDTQLLKERRFKELQEWFSASDWKKIASEWVKGTNIPWNSLCDHKSRRISLPTYPFEKESYWNPEPEYKPDNFEKNSDIKHYSISDNDKPSITLSEPSFYFIERFQSTIAEMEPLVTDISDLIITSKKEKWAGQFLGNYVYVEDFQTQEDWNQLLEKFIGSKIVWIQPRQTTIPLDILYKEETYQGLGALFIFAKSCISLGLDKNKIDWILFTRNAHQLDNESIDIAPAHAAMGGLSTVIGKELENWKVRIIDSLEPTRNIPKWIVENLEPQQWVMRKEQVYKKKLIRYQGEQTFKSVYKFQGTYIIAGGAGGVGRAYSDYLIKNYQATIIWIGRRSLDAGIKSCMKVLDPEEKHITYYQSDISEYSDLSSVYFEIKKVHGSVDGVIHSAMDSTDNDIRMLSESRFEKGLRAKIDGTLVLGRIFEKESLDFMIFFSSIGALGAMEGQGCYVASSCFKDSFSSYFNEKVKYPVKVVNWGYWGAVGFGAFIPEKLQTLLKEQSGVLQPEVANQRLEAFMGTSHQQAVISEKADFKKLIPLNNNVELQSNGVSNSSIIKNLKKHLPDRHNTVVSLRSNARFGIEEMEQLLAIWVLVNLRSIGILVNKENTLEEQKQQAGFNRFYDKWLEESLRVLEKNNLIAIDNFNLIRVLADPELLQIEKVTENWSLKKEIWGIDTYKKAQIKLLEASMTHLSKVLIGKMKGAEVVFPGSSMELVEDIYKNELGDYYNDVLTDNIIAFIKERIKQDSNTRIRLLEVGAGIGGTSSVIFERIRPYEAYIEEYCYTDISKAFLHYGEEEYGPDNSYLTYSLFDVSVPAPQDQIKETYDIVLATNVLHATNDIRNTLVNVKSVLKKNGVLLVNEISSKSLFFHMGFALLDGWWLYNDPELRIEGCPGLTSDTWNSVLQEHGFEEITFPALEAHDLGQQIIVAQSDGVISKKKTSSTIALKETNKQITEFTENLVNQFSTKKLGDKIQTIFSDVLKIPKEKIRSNVSFLDYGLDSIVAIKLVKTLQDVLELQIESNTVFKYDTMDTLLEYIQGAVSNETMLPPSQQVVNIKKEEVQNIDKQSLNPYVDVLKTIIHETLKVPVEKIREDRSLYDYGLDSILAVEISKKINTLLHTEITTTILTENSTISQLIKVLQPKVSSQEKPDTEMGNNQENTKSTKELKVLSEQSEYRDANVLKILENAQSQNFSISKILKNID